MQLVISDPKTGKAYTKKLDDPRFFLQRKVREEISLDEAGLEGYKAKITGGSDRDGFPMKADLQGTNRKSVYVYENLKKGLRIRKNLRGNVVDKDIHQLNLVVTAYGSKTLEELLPKQGATPEDAKSLKEKMIEESAKADFTSEEAKKLRQQIKNK